MPPSLKRLRLLVTVLTVTMIAGVLTIILLLVIRLNASAPPILVHPERFAVPAGVETLGYSLIGDRAVLVGDDQVIRVFDAESGALENSFPLD